MMIDPSSLEDRPPNLASRMQPLARHSCFTDPDYFIWGASMARDTTGLCHLFYSRWPKANGFNAWVSHSEIARATSQDPLGPYVHQEVVLPAREPEFWDGCCTHNPTILAHGGKYYLYYMGNRGDRQLQSDPDSLNWLHRNHQRIGLAVADDPAGPWTRLDSPLVDVEAHPQSHDALAVNNPAVTARPEGGFLMIYKAVGMQAPLPFGGPVVHCIATSDKPEGPFTKLPDPVFTCKEQAFPAEDPFIWAQGGRYYAILKDMNGGFSGIKRSLVQFESADGLDWKLSEPALVSDRNVSFEDQTSRRFDYLERPQLYLENGEPQVLFCAAREGNEAFNVHISLATEKVAETAS